MRRIQLVYVSKRLVRILRKQYHWIVEEELHSLGNKKKIKKLNNLKEIPPPVCHLEWPVCLDVFEKSKQKKRNSSNFAMRSHEIKCSQTNHFSLGFKNTNYAKSTLLKKKSETLERGRERGRRIDFTIDKPLNFMKDLRKGFNNSKNEEEDATQDDSQGTDDSIEITKSSENLTIIQNYLLIGRHDHTCQSNKKSFISQSKDLNNSQNTEQSLRDSITESKGRDSTGSVKKINRPSARTQFQRPPITYQINRESPLELPTDSQETTSNLKGLFGTDNFIKRQASPPLEEKPISPDKKEKSGVLNTQTHNNYSSDDSPVKEMKMMMTNEDIEDESFCRPRKTIFNLLISDNFDTDSDLTKELASGKKSIMFMREFFND